MSKGENTKSGSRVPYIPGTKPSIKNAQLLASTGIPSLDTLIGGGLPIGSIMLIEEDTYGTYAKVILKYFLAEGVISGHDLFVSSQDCDPEKLTKELPAVVESSGNDLDSHQNTKMQIAWRYENMKVVDSSPTSQSFGHFFDLTKQMDSKVLGKVNISTWNGDDLKYSAEGFINQAYINLLKELQLKLVDQFYVSANPPKRNLLRVGVHSLGSRLWISDNENESTSDFFKFLYCFRSLLRNSYAVAVITVPPHIFESQCFMKRVEHLVDTAIALESFVGSPKETNPVFKDYHGLLCIKKLSAFNTLAAHTPASFDLGFKMRRKKFIIEILHLPPDLDASEEQTGCGGGKLLDF